MSYMNKSSVKYKIAAIVYRNSPCTVERLFSLLPHISRKGLLATLGQLCTQGDVIREGDQLTVHANVRQHFAKQDADEQQIAGSRYDTAFKPLKLSRLPNLNASRAGADEFRSWLSVYAGVA